MSIPLPIVAARYIEGAAVQNVLFPAVSNYEDGRIVVLILGCCLATVALAIYAIGACPNCIRSWDIYTSQYVVLGAINTKGFQPVLKTTKFGGTLLATAVVVAGALCTDVLVQYVYEYGIEHSISTPALDSSARSTTNARVDLALTALRSPAQAQASCSLSSLTSSASVSGGFSLVSQSLPAPGPPNSSGLCSFAVVCPSVTVSVSPYASLPTPGAVTVGLGPYLQLSSWSLTIGAAKPGAYTVGQPKSSITTDFTGGGGRVHYVNVTLTPASYLDSTGLNSPGGVLTLGYRAGFAGYAAYPDPSATQASDTLVLLFSVSPLVLSTERALRFGILQLLGMLLGLAVGVLVLFKGFHELLDGLCECTRLERSEVVACLRCKPRERRWALTTADVLTASGAHAPGGRYDEEDTESRGGGGFGGVGLGGFEGGQGQGDGANPLVASNPLHRAPLPGEDGYVRPGTAAPAPPPPPGSKMQGVGMLAAMRAVSMRKLMPYSATAARGGAAAGAGAAGGGGGAAAGPTSSPAAGGRLAGSRRQLFAAPPPPAPSADAGGGGGSGADVEKAELNPARGLDPPQPQPQPAATAAPAVAAAAARGGGKARQQPEVPADAPGEPAAPIGAPPVEPQLPPVLPLLPSGEGVSQRRLAKAAGPPAATVARAATTAAPAPAPAAPAPVPPVAADPASSAKGKATSAAKETATSAAAVAPALAVRQAAGGGSATAVEPPSLTRPEAQAPAAAPPPASAPAAASGTGAPKPQGGAAPSSTSSAAGGTTPLGAATAAPPIKPGGPLPSSSATLSKPVGAASSAASAFSKPQGTLAAPGPAAAPAASPASTSSAGTAAPASARASPKPQGAMPSQAAAPKPSPGATASAKPGGPATMAAAPPAAVSSSAKPGGPSASPQASSGSAAAAAKPVAAPLSSTVKPGGTAASAAPQGGTPTKPGGPAKPTGAAKP